VLVAAVVADNFGSASLAAPPSVADTASFGSVISAACPPVLSRAVMRAVRLGSARLPLTDISIAPTARGVPNGVGAWANACCSSTLPVTRGVPSMRGAAVFAENASLATARGIPSGDAADGLVKKL